MLKQKTTTDDTDPLANSLGSILLNIIIWSSVLAEHN